MHMRNWLQLLLVLQVGIYSILSLTGSRGISTVWRTCRYTAQLRVQLAQKQEECRTRQNEVAQFRANYDFFVEKYARERLNMARNTDQVIKL